MAHTTTAVTSINDIPNLVRTFAAGLGYTTVDLGSNQITVQHPTYAGAKVFTVKPNISGSGATLRERIEISTDVASSTSALCESPKLNPTQTLSTAGVVLMQPTQLHLFGNLESDVGDTSLTGLSFIAGVIEYGFNLYRHFYLGYIEKLSAYDGGEVISGARCWVSHQTSGSVVNIQHWHHEETGYPFSGDNSSNTAVTHETVTGGAHISHANNPTPWRKFFYSAGASAASFDAAFATKGDSLIMGGYKDCVNSGYLLAGKSPYAGAQILTPINLYIGKRVSSQQFFIPVGRPGGARLVHMEDLEPGQTITIGSSVWRVFPVFSKQASAYMTKIAGGFPANSGFPPNNSSHYVGMAYLVSV